MLSENDKIAIQSMMGNAAGKVEKAEICDLGIGYHDEPNILFAVEDKKGNELGVMIFRDYGLEDIEDDLAEFLRDEYGLPLWSGNAEVN